MKLAALAPTFAGVKEVWKSVYYTTGALLGIRHFDESCVDLNRLFYTHRRPKDAQHWSIRVHGEALDFARLLAAARTTPPQPQASSSARPEATAKDGKHAYKTPGLAKFFALYAKHFNAADFIEAYGDDPMSANGGTAASCPNAHGSDERHADTPRKSAGTVRSGR